MKRPSVFDLAVVVLAVFALATGCQSPSRAAVHRSSRNTRVLLVTAAPVSTLSPAGRAAWLRGRDAALPNLDKMWLQTGGAEADAEQDQEDGLAR